MKFNSQICTTKEQSERLLACGLRKETADCILVENPFEKDRYIMFPIVDIDETTENEMNGEPIPAWSFHRLLELGNVFYIGHRNYDSLIRYIKDLIEEDIFNKEYLN